LSYVWELRGKGLANMRKSGRRWLGWLVVLLAFGIVSSGCSSTPTTRSELARFKDEYQKIEPDVSLLNDSFQALMMSRDMAQLHQRQLKAEAMQREWETLKFAHSEISDLQFEVSMALQGIGHGYGLGYIRVLRGDRDVESEGKAVDASTEGAKHIVAMYDKMMVVQSKLP
jgi:hypothetical protein